MTKQIIIRLSPKQAELVMQNIDGWMDAGACEDGLTKEEHEALNSAHDQIMKQLQKLKSQSS